MKKILSQFNYLIILILLFGPILYLRAEESSPASVLERILRNPSRGFTVSNDAVIKAFYEKRKNEPAWRLGENNARSTVKDFIGFIRATLNDHGLSDKRYPFALLQAKVEQQPQQGDNLLQADIIATDIVMRLAHSLAGEDASPQSKLHTWPLRRTRLDLSGGLSAAVEDRTVAPFLEALVPKIHKYERLREALVEYRAIKEKGGWIKLPPRGTTLKPGDTDERIPMLHQRLAQEGYLPFDAARYQNPVYDEPLIEAVKQFQDTHGLNPDAVIGPETIRAFNVSVGERIDQIRVNMARIRQSPRDAWEDIVINVPSARLSYFRDGKEVYEAPVVVGRIDRPTPLVASEIYEMIINPPWYVPRSIAQKDILPKLKDNPEYLESIGISLRGEDDGSGDIAGRLKQRPGPGNSLGRLKFNFHNLHAVYLHGTPHTELFDRDDRTRSSGCVRLQKPDELAMIFLKDQPGWSPDVLQKKIDSVKTITVKAPRRTPIKLLYWTVLVDEKDRVNFFNDVYGLDHDWLGYL
jgi:murein L,D-transpeptidase YcbB/YkuD